MHAANHARRRGKILGMFVIDSNTCRELLIIYHRLLVPDLFFFACSSLKKMLLVACSFMPSSLNSSSTAGQSDP
jgi:hypothetical protein